MGSRGLGIIATVIAAVLPALVGIWQARLGLSADQAGFVAAAELFAQVVGTGAFIWAARAWSWRACAAVGLGIMIIGNLASAAHLVLAGTASSAELINNDFRAIRRALPAKTRARIAALERRGIYTRAGAYRTSYARLCRKALAKYNYVQPQSEMPDETGTVSWEVLREMWVRKSDFRIDGNLRDFDLTDSLGTLRLPTLIMIGDRDLVSRRSAGILHAAIPGSQLVIMRDAGHMMFVDQRAQFLHILGGFLLRHS